MLNQIRADFYRLSHTLGIYFTLIFTIIFSSFTILNNSVGGIMITDSPINNKLNPNSSWSLYDGIKASTLSASTLIYIFIGIFTITIGYEFSQHVYKNTLVSGITRSQFIISKYLVMLFNIFLFVLTYFFTSIITGVLDSRAIGTTWKNLLSTTINTSIVISFFISVIFGLAILILLLTSSNVFSTVFIVIFPILISLFHIISNWDWLKYFDFFNVAIKISLKLISNEQLSNYILISGLVLIITIGISIFIIKHKEL